MLIMKRLIGLRIHRGMAVPAERFQRLSHKLVGLCFSKCTLLVVNIEQRPATRGENVTFCENGRSGFTQRFVVNQL
ncbi:hypothetical protein D3C75_964170 [compost metagenome]